MARDFSRQQEVVKQQTKVNDANVLILGTGAIGSALAHQLARLGVGSGTGKLVLVDGDKVEESNLNRQLFGAIHVGKNKAMATEAQLVKMVPGINVSSVPKFVNEGDIKWAEYDAVFFAIDSLFVTGKLWAEIMALPESDRPAVFVTRMSAFAFEIFSYWSNGPKATGIYFADEPDKDYGAHAGATCTGAKVEEKKVPAIVTTTNIVAGFAGNAFIAFANEWPFVDHFRADLKAILSDSLLTEAQAP